MVVGGAVPAAEPSNTFIGANEIHIPVGETVAYITRGRCDPQLLGPQPERQKGSDPGSGQRVVPVRRQPRDLSRAMRRVLWCATCAYGAVCHCRAQDKFAGWQEKQRRPAKQPQNAEQERGQQVFLRGPCVMCHTIPGHDSRRDHRTRSDARRQPPLDRRRPAAEYARPSRRLDPRPADPEARQSDAAKRCCRPRISRRCSATSTVWNRNAHSERHRHCRLQPTPDAGAAAFSSRPGLEPPGIIGWLSDADHKTIGIRYHRHRFGFFMLAGLLAAADAHAARPPGKRRSSGPISTTSSSRRTARR